eukprot:4119398-Amphidinium_carterae.1
MPSARKGVSSQHVQAHSTRLLDATIMHYPIFQTRLIPLVCVSGMHHLRSDWHLLQYYESTGCKFGKVG